MDLDPSIADLSHKSNDKHRLDNAGGHEQPVSPSSQPSSSLFVRSLPNNITTEGLTTFFSQSFPVKHAVVILDKESGQSKGFGFVTFADVEDAQSAKSDLNGRMLHGKKLQVDFAKPRQRKVEAAQSAEADAVPPENQSVVRQSRARVTPRHQVEEDVKLIVRNLPWSVKTTEQVARLFLSYGKVRYATLPRCRPGLSPGFGFVILRGRKNAEKAISGVNGKLVDGRAVAVDFAVDKDAWLKDRGTQSLGSEQSDSVAEPEGGLDDTGQLSDADSCGTSISKTLNGSNGNPPKAMDAALRLSQSASEASEQTETEKADDVSTTLFVRNLPYAVTDEMLLRHFSSFSPVRYARVVINPETGRSRGTGFVCFYDRGHANSCLLQAPRSEAVHRVKPGNAVASSTNGSILQDSSLDPHSRFTIQDRVLYMSQAVGRDQVHRITAERTAAAATQDGDRRHLYLLSEGIIPSNSPLYESLSPSEIRMQEQNATSRQKVVKSNSSLYLSLTRLSIRNIPRQVTSKDLKELAREAVVGFAKDVKESLRQPLSKEELNRDRDQMKAAEQARRMKGKGIVKQAKIVCESYAGSKTGASGAGISARSRGYGFIEYTSHRFALMGLRWLNNRPIPQKSTLTAQPDGQIDGSKRLVAEFAIENAAVLARRQMKSQAANNKSAFG